MVAAGGRHALVLSDTGALLTFGLGLYGLCEQGSTNDLLRPTSVSSFTGIQVKRIAAGLWHTMCISVEGHVYVFGGNQLGQLGTGADQAETKPKLLDAPILENKRAKVVSCGAGHIAMLAEDGQVLSWGWNKYGQIATSLLWFLWTDFCPKMLHVVGGTNYCWVKQSSDFLSPETTR